MKDQIDACYFCTTPYQILGAISLVTENEEIADLYIVGQFSSYSEVAKRITQKNIFRKVIAIDEYEIIGLTKRVDNKLLKRLLMPIYYLKVKNIGDKILEQDVFYKKMYLTSQSFIVRLIYFYLLRYNPDTQFICFDDGIGSYYDSSLFKIRFPDKVMRLLLFGQKSIDNDLMRVLYMPQIYNSEEKTCVEDLVRMPKINTTKANLDKLNFIFDFKNEDLIKEKVIIFDTLKEELYGSKGSDLLNSYYKMICTYLGENNVIIKNHPRSKDMQINGFNYYNNYEMPSEVLYLNMDVEQKILVTAMSTAVLTPKFIMDKEPIIIMLYKIMDSYYPVAQNQHNFFQNVRQTYKNKDRFYIPKDEIELENILRRLKDIL